MLFEIRWFQYLLRCKRKLRNSHLQTLPPGLRSFRRASSAPCHLFGCHTGHMPLDASLLNVYPCVPVQCRGALGGQSLQPMAHSTCVCLGCHSPGVLVAPAGLGPLWARTMHCIFFHSLVPSRVCACL